MALADYLKSIPQALTNPIGLATSLLKPKAPAPTGFEPLNPQAQAIRNAAQTTIKPPAANPAATSVKPALASPAVPTRSLTDSGCHSVLSSGDPALAGNAEFSCDLAAVSRSVFRLLCISYKSVPFPISIGCLEKGTGSLCRLFCLVS